MLSFGELLRMFIGILANTLLYVQGGTEVSDNLYFKSAMFKSNKSLAEYVFSELKKLNFNPESPIDSDYMFSIAMNIDGVMVDVYLGKNDEESETPLWQIWPEQRISFFKKFFGKVNKSPELKARQVIENIAKNIEGVTDVAWDI